MILDKMFSCTKADFEKRCRTRILVGAGIILLGVVALAAAFMYGHKVMPLILEGENRTDFIRGFYTGSGCGLIAAGVITIIKNIRYLKNDELRKMRALEEGDERNQMIGQKCWAYAGYSLLLCLYVGILLSGYISFAVLQTLLVVLAVYGGLLLIFKILLNKAM